MRQVKDDSQKMSDLAWVVLIYYCFPLLKSHKENLIKYSSQYILLKLLFILKNVLCFFKKKSFLNSPEYEHHVFAFMVCRRSMSEAHSHLLEVLYNALFNSEEKIKR